ncbi:DNA repair Swi5, partial [Tubulinosema ratisbonensis]
FYDQEIKNPIIHKSKILNYDFLLENECLTLIEDDYYCLSKDLEDIKALFYDQEIKKLTKELEIQDVNLEIKNFISKLNKYNELKDIGQAMIGKIADLKGITIKEANEIFEIKEEY